MRVVQVGASWRKKIKYIRVCVYIFMLEGARRARANGWNAHSSIKPLARRCYTCTAQKRTRIVYIECEERTLTKNRKKNKTIIFRVRQSCNRACAYFQRCRCSYLLLLLLPLLWIFMFLLVLQSGRFGQRWRHGGYATMDGNTLFPLSWKIIIFLCSINNPIRVRCVAMILSSLQHRIPMCVAVYTLRKWKWLESRQWQWQIRHVE